MAGETVTAALMNTHVRDNFDAIGGAWTSYTPTLAQGASTNIAKTVIYAKYLSIGKLIIAQVYLQATAGGTAGSAITVSLPVVAASFGFVVGSGFFYDASVTGYPAVVYLNSTTNLSVVRADAAGVGEIGSDTNIAVASSDILRVSAMYEAL